MERGKKYQEAAKLVEDRPYAPQEAVSLTKQTSFVNFDATVELHLRMGLDPRHADQQVRGVALLPNGLGKPVRVLVFAQGEAAQMAQQAGADYVGDDDLIKQIEGGWIEFDTSIATQDMMGKVSRLGRILGRRGLMPNPRAGTVVQPEDIGRAIRDAKKGRVEFRLDRTAIIHVPIGKVSFEDSALLQNMATLVDSVVRAKPTGGKGQYIRSAYLASSMGPGVRLDLAPTLALASSAT